MDLEVLERNKVYFEDLNIPKDARIAFDGLERVIPSRQHSHNAAWVHLYKNMLHNAGWKNTQILKKDDLYEGFDVLIVFLGIAYSGNINFFFGVDHNVCWRFKRIQDFSGKILVMNHEMPLIGSTIKPRLSNKSTSSKVSDLNLSSLDLICKQTVAFDYVKRENSLVFGDSHSFSTYSPGKNVCRNDGLTLYGALKRGLKETIEQRSGKSISEIESLTLYMGNIDIRHHLCRLEDPIEETQKLVKDYIDQACKLGVKELKLVHSLPIENESRKLPKSGYYKGTPFFGSWRERRNLHVLFNSLLDRYALIHGYEVFKWPECFLNFDNELDFEYMERPKSVHLSPLSYYWDLNKNCVNKFHERRNDEE